VLQIQKKSVHLQMEYIIFDSKIVEKKAKAELKKIADGLFVKVGRTDFVSLEGAKQITKIRIHSSDFTNEDLKDLRYFTELKLLEIFSFNLTDLQHIPSLEKLESLCIRSDSVTIDLKPLTKLVRLKKLDLEGLYFEDLAPLSTLKKLKRLKLSCCKISDLTFLRDLTSITELRLEANSISDISPLANLKKLKELYFTDNHITDLNPLKSLTSLKILYLNENLIVDIKPITRLEALETLDISGNKIKDITCLEKCINLSSLSISRNRITSIETLFHLKKLNFLSTDKHKLFEPLSSIFENKTVLKVGIGRFSERTEYECYAFSERHDEPATQKPR
jgi:internalin A